MLQSLSSLKKLSLSKCNLGDKAISIICNVEIEKRKDVFVDDFTRKNSGQKKILKLQSMLDFQNPNRFKGLVKTLEYLNISNNCITDVGA